MRSSNLPLSRRRFIGSMTAVALAAQSVAAQAAVTPQAPAPDFTLRSLEGRNTRLKELRGNVVLVNFWATWCGPCKQEMPHLNRLYEKYRSSGFTLLGINIDEDSRKAGDLVTRMGLKFPILLDADKTVSRTYDLNSMPATVLVDRDGRVRHVHRGYREGYENTYDEQIRALLKE
jgi:peroxiredoxin